MERKGAAIHVLNQIQKKIEPTSKCISGIGRLEIDEEVDNDDVPLQSRNASMTEHARTLQRKQSTLSLSRGQKMCKLVKELGLGVLFIPWIW